MISKLEMKHHNVAMRTYNQA